MLAVENLSFGYGRRRVGSDVSFAVDSGSVLCLLGPNGCGKTTLLKTILGLLPPLAGRVFLDGTDLRGLSRREAARRVAYVPQAHGAFFPFTVREVAVMGRASHLGAFSSPGPEDENVAFQALQSLGVAHLADADYSRISGGERQLVLIARALAGEPRLLVMDEPTASLDFGNQARVLSRVRQLSSAGITIVFSTHDPGHALLCGDRVAALRDGALAAFGPPPEVVTPPLLHRLYGVEVLVASVPGAEASVCAPVIGPRSSARTGS